MARKDDDDDNVKKTPSDAYVGLSAICLVALIAAAVLFYLDGDALATGTPQPTEPSVKLAAGGLNKLAVPGVP